MTIFKKGNPMRPIVSTVVLFASACFAFAGGDWWELYTKDEQKKFFVEYEKYLYPGKDGKPSDKIGKAALMLRKVGGYQASFLSAQIAWSDLSKKDGADKASAQYRKEFLYHIYVANGGQAINFSEKLPDRMIDEYLWAFKTDIFGNREPSLWVIGSFGPRANRVHNELRDYLIEHNLTTMK
jgi:hypothetical protein